MRIPKSEYESFRAFVAEPASTLQAIAAALESDSSTPANRNWSLERLVDVIRSHAVNKGNAELIARLLGTLTSVRRQRLESAGETIAKVAETLSALPETGIDLKALASRQEVLARLIGAPIVEIMVKVWELGSEFGNAVDDLRVLTDIRPVFDEDVTRPLLGVVTHTLRVRMLDRSGPLGSTVHFTLDGADLVNLAAQIDRALQKSAAIRTTVGPALQHGICVLNDLEDDQ